MTEQEWLACRDPQPMLDHVRSTAKLRQFRLFGYSCCRHIEASCGAQAKAFMTDSRIQHLLGMIDKTIDGGSSSEELRATRETAMVAARELRAGSVREVMQAGQSVYFAVDVVTLSTPSGVHNMASNTAICAAHAQCILPNNDEDKERHSLAKANQAELIREIVGNPFRPVSFDDSWLTSTVRSLAQGIHDERAFDRMPILADALEEAGCTNDEILGHCRGPGPHVRGCWVVDLLLGKE